MTNDSIAPWSDRSARTQARRYHTRLPWRTRTLESAIVVTSAGQPADRAAARELEVPDCPMCGASARITRYRFPPYAVVRCAVCRFHYLSPRLPEQAMLDLYRSGEYFEGGEVGYQSYSDQEPALRATFRRVTRELVRSGFAGGDLLEVGCGYGFLLEEAKGSFRSVIGTEFSEGAAAAARSRGLDVVTGGLDALPDANRQFDCIVSAHVVEHVYDPRAFVGTLRGRLHPGGALVLGTPDIGSGWRRTMHRRWPSFKIPEHVLYFDRRSLARLLRESGMEDIHTFPYPHSFPLALVIRKLGLQSLAKRLGRISRTPIWLPATTLALSARRPRGTP